MDMTRFTGSSNFFRAEDLRPDTLIKTSIVSVALREFKDGEKAVVYTDFQGKGVVLNVTRAQVLYAAYGLESENWIGKPIIIRLGEEKFEGKKVGAVAIEAMAPTRLGVEQRPALFERRGSTTITSGHRMPPTPPAIETVKQNPITGDENEGEGERTPPITRVPEGRAEFDDDLPF
jgi:hypothetical protein